MFENIAVDTGDHEPVVSTGELPAPEVVRDLLDEAWRRFRGVTEGEVAGYIPALAAASPSLFGLAIVGTDGAVYTAGDASTEFSMQSVSKPFVLALVCEAIGDEAIRARIGVNSTGLPFNSVMAIELNEARTMNPMVNAGAIATSSLLPGRSADDRWLFALDGLSRFAGRRLAIDHDVYRSEAASNQRNQGIARLLESYGRIYCDPLEATEVYTRQCSVAVTVADLAVMSATLAGGGVNPVTGQRVVSALTCKRVLAVLATAGLYERSGAWLFETGLPAKSGVSGGIITVAPGKVGMATFSPLLDPAGNSVRGQLATSFLSETLGLNLFASAPAGS